MAFEIFGNEQQRNIELRGLENEERSLLEGIRENLLRLFAIRYDLVRGMFDKLKLTDTGKTIGISEGYTTSAPELDEEARPELQGVTANISYYLRTNAGGPKSKYQNRNEDAFLLNIKRKYDLKDPDEETLAVFDGVGGSGQGVLASRIAVAATLQNVNYGGSKNFRDIAQRISKEISQHALGGAATGAVVHYEDTSKKWSKEMGGGRRVKIMAAGDTKVLTVRSGRILPEGTTVLQNSAFEYDKGKGNYYTAHNLNEITTSFGGSYPVEAQVLSFEPQAQDVIVVATDALWDNVSDYEILELLKLSGAEFERQLYDLTYQRNNSETPFHIRHAPEKIVEKKLKAGDNITLGVMRIRH